MTTNNNEMENDEIFFYITTTNKEKYDNAIENDNDLNKIYSSLLNNDNDIFSNNINNNTRFYIFYVPTKNELNISSIETTTKIQLYLGGTWTGPINNEFIEILDDNLNPVNINSSFNTTDYDNMPVSIIEAMALGFPIVSTNPGGIPFLLRDEFDAMLVNKNDVNGMVKKITEITISPDLSFTLSKRARRKAEDFSWSEVSIKWEKLLQVY